MKGRSQMESGFWCHPKRLDNRQSVWICKQNCGKICSVLRKFMRHREAEGQLGGSGERPELLRVGLRQRLGSIG